MNPEKPFPYDVLEADQTNIQISIDVLTKHAIFELYERVVPELFAGLLPAVQHTAPAGFFPFTRRDSNGVDVPTYDFILRLFMLQSANEQFIFSLGHLLRGHGSEVPAHLRRASESAGIAYLSKAKPELGDIFMSGDERKLRNATKATAILPPDDPLTADLLKSMNFASALTHNNFVTFVGRANHDISIKDGKWTIKLALNLYGGPDLGVYLRLALWGLRVIERVLRVFAVSFDLPTTSDWHLQLSQFAGRLDRLYIDLDQIVRPE